MDEMFEEVLALCLDRLADGDDVATCVAEFPECPDLAPLLEIAAALSATRSSGRGRPFESATPRWLTYHAEPRVLRPTG